MNINRLIAVTVSIYSLIGMCAGQVFAGVAATALGEKITETEIRNHAAEFGVTEDAAMLHRIEIKIVVKYAKTLAISDVGSFAKANAGVLVRQYEERLRQAKIDFEKLKEKTRLNIELNEKEKNSLKILEFIVSQSESKLYTEADAIKNIAANHEMALRVVASKALEKVQLAHGGAVISKDEGGFYPAEALAAEYRNLLKSGDIVISNPKYQDSVLKELKRVSESGWRIVPPAELKDWR